MENVFISDAKEQIAEAQDLWDWETALSVAEEALEVVEDDELESLRDMSQEQVNSDLYDQAISAVYFKQFDQAQMLFEKLGDYEDSLEYLGHLKAGEQGRLYLDTIRNFTGTNQEKAERFRKVGEYADAPEQAEYYEQLAKQETYAQAIDYIRRRNWEAAAELLAGLEGYEDSDIQLLICKDGLLADRYQDAENLLSYWDEPVEALEIFTELGTYKDSILKAEECRTLLRDASDFSGIMREALALREKLWYSSGITRRAGCYEN